MSVWLRVFVCCVPLFIIHRSSVVSVHSFPYFGSQIILYNNNNKREMINVFMFDAGLLMEMLSFSTNTRNTRTHSFSRIQCQRMAIATLPCYSFSFALFIFCHKLYNFIRFFSACFCCSLFLSYEFFFFI